jgi:hypothetical protein
MPLQRLVHPPEQHILLLLHLVSSPLQRLVHEPEAETDVEHSAHSAGGVAWAEGTRVRLVGGSARVGGRGRLGVGVGVGVGVKGWG